MILEEQKSSYSNNFTDFNTHNYFSNLTGIAGYNQFSSATSALVSSHINAAKKFSHYSSFETSSTSTSYVMQSLSGGTKTVARNALTDTHHDEDGDNHGHAPNEISSSGATYNPSAAPSATDPYYVNALKSGYVWANSGTGITINYKFWSSLPSYYSGADQESYNFQPFTAAMKTATQEALGFLQNLINVTFVQVASESSAQLGFAQAQLSAGAGAWAYYPGSYAKAGDVWTNNLYAASTQNVAHGTYGFQTLLHEIGHAMGLKHSFSGTDVLTGAEDTSRYTVMSYTWPVYAESYMLYDIAALQTLYGANTTYASGNNSYSLLSGHAYTIWDTGGEDTLDGSALTANLTLNLNEGTFSNVGLTQNIALAFGVTIENASGGTGNDIIYGNAVANNIQGNGGNDIIYGSAGSDTLDGGDGTDTLNYSVNLGNFSVNAVNASTLLLTSAATGTDMVSNIENFNFNGVAATFANLLALSGGSIDIISTSITSGRTTYSFDSLLASTRTISSSNLGLRGTATNMFTLDRINATDMDVTVLSALAPGKISFTADGDGSNISIMGTHRAMAVTFNGGAGDDSFTAASTLTGNDKIYGGEGNDTFHTGNGNDLVCGDDGNDALYGETGNDIMYGGIGADNIAGGDGHDKLYGGDGNDTISGGTGNDIILGNNDNDTINGDDGNDKLYGGEGNDTLHGGLGADLLYGENGDDTLYGDDSNDKILGGSGTDILYGGAGNDALYGETDDDILQGEDGNDNLFGGAGNDLLIGGAGNDNLYGNDGDDIIIMGIGKDIASGMTGIDLFVFDTLDAYVDTIKDFTLTGLSADKINITDILTGYDSLTDDIHNFVQITGSNTTKLTLTINQDGVGTDWTTAAVITGSKFTGVTVDSLIASGQLIVDQPV